MPMRDAILIEADTELGFRVTLTLSVRDAGALWSAAAARALAGPGMTIDDVLETLGPRVDPSLADCIAMLASPPALPGCDLFTFAVDAFESRPQPLLVRQNPARDPLETLPQRQLSPWRAPIEARIG